jgi:hypothetical protein
LYRVGTIIEASKESLVHTPTRTHHTHKHIPAVKIAASENRSTPPSTVGPAHTHAHAHAHAHIQAHTNNRIYTGGLTKRYLQ